MKSFVPLSSRSLNTLLTGLVLALVVILALAAWLMPAPQLRIAYQDSVVEVFADRAWVLLPGDCARISWEFDSVFPIHIDGVEWRESGEQQFCPQVFAPSPKIELTDHRQGVYLSPSLGIYYLPDVVANVLALAALAFFPMLATYYLWSNSLDKRPPLLALCLIMLALCFLLAVLRLTGLPITIVGALAYLRGLFTGTAWNYFGIAITVALYLCLLVHAFWRGWRDRRITDFLVVVSFMLFIGLLYLPFGFDSIGQWEEWFNRGFFEGLYRRRLFTELSQRFSFLWPHGMGFILSPGSFTGHNMLYALLLWGKLAFFYGIIRCFSVRQLFAYLITMLFFVYPVDSGLMNARSIALQFSVLNLLAGIYLALQYMRNPTRLRLAGLLLALVISVGAYEAQYALILVMPLLWWHRIRKPLWRVANLTAIWYLAPAYKLTYLVFIVLTGRSFYRSNYVYAGTEFGDDNLVLTTFDNLLEVYRRTFVVGWGDALTGLGRSSWLPLTFVMFGLVGILAWYVWNREENPIYPDERKLLLGVLTGGLLIIPAAGVLIWFGYYSQDLWRLYLYVPGPAAIALFSFIALVASRIPSDRYRDSAIIIACLLLMLPAISRLILQHEHYVISADNKRQVLQQILQIVPELESETRVLVLSDMPDEVRLSKHIEEMISNMVGSALYVVYGGGVSGLGSMCASVESCSPLSDWADHLSDTLVFLLHDDLALELVKEPARFFSEFQDLPYDVTRLYNPDAPLPQRAYTMLGLTES